MKAGLTLNEMAAELTRQQALKKDFIADTRSTRIVVTDAKDFPAGISGAPVLPKAAPTVSLVVKNGAEHAYSITPHAHSQMASRLNIPAVYYQRMLTERPSLLADNVNEWLHSKPERRLIRTLGPDARAYLSDRYRRLDNLDLAEATLPVLAEAPEMRIESSQITATRFYLKAVFPKIQAEVKKGDVVQAGILIRNSEVGDGSLAVEPLIFRLACLNGMIRQDLSMKKYHTGRRGAHDDEAYEVFADDTMKADDRAFWLKVRDMVKAGMADVAFHKSVDKLRESTTGEKIASPVQAVEELARTLSLTDSVSSSVLRHLIEGGDLSRYGAIQAVTRASQDVADYDLATDLEMAGGKILDLDSSQWRAVATAGV